MTTLVQDGNMRNKNKANLLKSSSASFKGMDFSIRIHPTIIIEGHQGTEEKSITTKGAVAARLRVAAWVWGEKRRLLKNFGPELLTMKNSIWDLTINGVSGSP